MTQSTLRALLRFFPELQRERTAPYLLFRGQWDDSELNQRFSPIKIKIKKEKEESFKDLKNEKWLREFELEVTNTGDKPIYFLYITMGTNVKVDTGLEMVYPLVYGREQLGDIFTKPTSDDIPIKPGDTHILKIIEAPYFEKGVRENRWPQSTKFTAQIQVLSFGDGTGYFGTELFPPPGRPKGAVNDVKLPQPSKGRARPRERLISKLGAHSKSASTFKQPTFMSANFLSSDKVIVAAPSAAQPFVTCQFPECIPVVPWTGYVCYDNDETRGLGMSYQNLSHVLNTKHKDLLEVRSPVRRRPRK